MPGQDREQDVRNNNIPLKFNQNLYKFSKKQRITGEVFHMDKKRGQVTLFVILGIVIVAIIVLVLSFKSDIIVSGGSKEDLGGVMKGISDQIDKCLKKQADGPIKKIALQGGYLSPSAGTYRLWNDTTISYLCYNMQNSPTCINRLLTVEGMEKQLAKQIEEGLKTCVDIQPKGLIPTYDIFTPQDYNVTVRILLDAVNINLDYPITLKSKKNKDVVVTKKEFKTQVAVPLGDLVNVVYSIINAETSVGFFDQLTYMLTSKSKYTIYVHKPYPDKIYRLKLREDDFTFQFAVEGEPGS
jgi:hypothetical protein